MHKTQPTINTNNYIPLHVHSHFSLLDGLSQPQDIADRIVDLKLPGSALTDHGSISGCIKFIKIMNETNKKWILGSELYISNEAANIKTKENRSLSHQIVLAKNLQGWKSLIKIISASNKPDNFYYKPRLSWTQLSDLIDGNLIGISGHLGSTLANMLISENKLKLNWKQIGTQAIQNMKTIFGDGNFYIEIQLIDKDNNEIIKPLTESLRLLGDLTNTPCVATADSHYATKQDADDHRILLCKNLNTTLDNVQKKLQEGEQVALAGFFKSSNYHIPSYEEMVACGHTSEELHNTLRIAEQCSDYDILSKPKLHPFSCPGGKTPDEYLRELCREGWTKKIKNKVPQSKYQEYINRIKHELDILQDARLSSYFLIVWDVVQYIKSQQWLRGTSRGSVAGCLVAYLIDISSVDPIKYGLIFSRFYNSGRNTEDNISMPDIDLDVPASKRDNIIEYIKQKYGHDKVAQMVTYISMQGRSALKDVLRARDVVSVEETNKITEHIPEKSKISDDLEIMKQSSQNPSIILWALEHRAEKLKEWCYIDQDGNLQGELSKLFEQSIRLENTITSQSRHPAGVVLSPEPLENICPMIYDASTKETVSGFDMDGMEAIGLIKLDILALLLLDKISGIQQLLKTGEINESITAK